MAQLLVSGCANNVKEKESANEVVYFGKGEAWLATFSVFQVNQSLFDSLYIQYIGGNREEKIGPIEYSLAGDGFKSESQYPQELQGVRSFQVSTEANADIFSFKPNEDGVYTLTVKYKGGTETLTLSALTPLSK